MVSIRINRSQIRKNLDVLIVDNVLAMRPKSYDFGYGLGERFAFEGPDGLRPSASRGRNRHGQHHLSIVAT